MFDLDGGANSVWDCGACDSDSEPVAARGGGLIILDSGLCSRFTGNLDASPLPKKVASTEPPSSIGVKIL